MDPGAAAAAAGAVCGCGCEEPGQRRSGRRGGRCGRGRARVLGPRAVNTCCDRARVAALLLLALHGFFLSSVVGGAPALVCICLLLLFVLGLGSISKSLELYLCIRGLPSYVSQSVRVILFLFLFCECVLGDMSLSVCYIAGRH
jgi:hypothetical protein